MFILAICNRGHKPEHKTPKANTNTTTNTTTTCLWKKKRQNEIIKNKEEGESRFKPRVQGVGKGREDVVVRSRSNFCLSSWRVLFFLCTAIGHGHCFFFLCVLSLKYFLMFPVGEDAKREREAMTGVR